MTPLQVESDLKTIHDLEGWVKVWSQLHIKHFMVGQTMVMWPEVSPPALKANASHLAFILKPVGSGDGGFFQQ